MRKILFILFVLVAFKAVVPQVEAQNTVINNVQYYKSEGNSLLVDLVSLWPFDEPTGTTAFDAHGSNDLANTNATVNQTGIIDKAYSFNGSSSYCRFGSPLVSGTPVTLSVWVNFAVLGVSDQYTLLCIGNSGSADDVIRIFHNTGTDRGMTIQQYDGSNDGSIISGYYPNTGEWVHVVAVFTSNSSRTMYVDGVNVGTNTTVVSALTTQDHVSVGRLEWTTNIQYVNGLITQPAIWDRALTQENVDALYNSGAGVPYTNFSAWIKLIYDNLLQRKYNIQIPYKMAS